MSLQPRKPLKNLISVSFNQDATCLSVALTNGFRTFVTVPFSESFHHQFDAGGIAIAEMLFRSSLVALVGGGPMPKFPANKVMIWDDRQKRPVAELAFKTQVRSLRLRIDRIAAALEQKVFLYDVDELRLLHSVETAPNPEGLLALSPSQDSTVLACPGLHAGQVRIDLLDTKRSTFIQAHDNPLSALALSHNGKYVATASEKGTLIRVFSTLDGKKVRELRRGSDPAKIYSIAFSKSIGNGGGGGGGSGSSGALGATGELNGLPEWLAVSSDKGTVHVFNLTGKASAGGSGEEVDELERSESGGSGGASASAGGWSGGSSGTSPTKTSSGRLVMKSISSLTRFVPNKVGGAYLASERSWSQYKCPDSHKCTVAFGNEPGTLLIASVTGALHRVVFDPERKGPCEQLGYTLFMEEEE